MVITRSTHELTLDVEAQNLLFREARTANAFTEKEVTDDQVRMIYDLVKYAPTSMNQQPLRVVLARSRQARRTLIEHMNPSNKRKVANAPLVAILAADLNFHRHLHRLFPHVPDAEKMFADPSARASSARFNAILQVGYFIIGVRAAGLAAGPLVGYDADGINKEFFPSGEQVILAVLNMGYPRNDAWFPRLARLDYHEVVTTV